MTLRTSAFDAKVSLPDTYRNGGNVYSPESNDCMTSSRLISLRPLPRSAVSANNKHDVTAIQVYDKRDAQLPDVGLMRVVDLETGNDRWVNTSSQEALVL